MKNERSRKWQLTINNPQEHNLEHNQIKEKLQPLTNILYWCMNDEIGEQDTYHTHLYIVFENAVVFSTLKKIFEQAHIEKANGSSQENKEYIKKEGKWAETEKAETNIKETFEEFGEMPAERQGKRNDNEIILNMIKDGYSNIEIMETYPNSMYRVQQIEAVRQLYAYEKHADDFRDVIVTYIYGKTGVGKTRSVMDKYGYRNVYSVTDYAHPFDGYKAQDVILFEEFRSSLQISDMLKYLDGYPLQLPCRYANKIALYTKVYIISNISIDKQYTNVQIEQAETYKAFIRRINSIIYMPSIGVEIEELEP